jgi:3,4-dihydroxy 2-butanone 4-phosphate synthase/GTP cyclohydrolase II
MNMDIIMEPLIVERKVKARIPTRDGEFFLNLYTNNWDEKDHLALVYGDVDGRSDVLVRVHSECFTGDVLGSQRCDCGEQLEAAMKMIAVAGEGVLIYLRQEGRGIGLLDKLRAYNLQDQGYDTVEANLALGHEADERDYTIAALILADLGVESVCLLTNNPLKIENLSKLGVPVTRRVPLEATPNAENAGYLFTKVIRMNHLLNLESVEMASAKNGNGSNGRSG